jgi:D-alanyl-D-alanine carboxypeptidase
MIRSETSRRIRLFACLAMLAALGACGTSHTHRSAIKRSPTRYYPPPGPSSDPWGPYIREASGRFGVPETWVRRVMRQESGGQEDVISWAGAMGLMQVMPDTYDGLRQRYSLGDDPFDPHNNILAGTAYLREMYDRFGSPGFLAAYNAGPNRLDKYLSYGTPLPTETVNYVAAIAPQLGTDRPMSGPLAVYGGGARVIQVAARPTPAGCDPDAAYNPDGPCTKPRPQVIAPMAEVPMAASAPYVREYCDPDAAYDPSRPCRMPPAAPVEPPPAPSVIARTEAPPIDRSVLAPPARYASENRRPLQERMAQPVAFSPGIPSAPPPGRWMIQVGAFGSLSTAQAAAERARAAAPDLLDRTKIELPATVPFGNQVAFRSRLSGLTAHAASEACGRLSAHGMACMTVPPSPDSY